MHILATLLHRCWSVIAGGVTVLLIPFCLNSVQQGYYFAFASILALQIFFELGMGQVVVQTVAHEAAHLRKTPAGDYHGECEHMARLYLLRAQLRRWYVPSALLFALIVSAVGLVFFRNGGLPSRQWAPVWTLLVATTAINLYFSWKTSMVEGFALIQNIAQLRLGHSVVGYALMWLGLLNGAGLWVVLFVPATAACATALWMRASTAAPIFQIRSLGPPSQPISWRHDILPFQWRIAVSWVSGYFIFQLFTPLMFRRVGAAEAGRLGLAITVFSAISTVGLSWINAKAPSLSMLIARRESAALIAGFKSLALRSLLFTIAMSAALLAAVWAAKQYHLAVIDRIASLPVLIALATVTAANCIIFSAAVYMRAHREEPMLPVSVISGVLTAAVAWYGSKHGAFEMMLGYALVTVLVGLPWTLFILRGYIARDRKIGG